MSIYGGTTWNGMYGNGGVPYGGLPAPQAPIVPQQGGGYAINGPVDIVVPQAVPGMPQSSLPPVIVRPAQGGSPESHPNFGSTQPYAPVMGPGPVSAMGNPYPPSVGGPSPLPAPAYQVGAVPYAQSFPVSNQAAPFPPMVDVPPPHLAAPWVFYTPPRMPVSNGYGNPNFQNNYYNNMYGNQGGYGPYPPTYPPQGWPNPYGAQGPQQPNPNHNGMNPNGPNTPPVNDPAAKTPDAKEPEVKSPDAKTPDAKAEDAKDPDNLPKIPNSSRLTDQQVRSLNNQLTDPNAAVRSNGAMDFYKILEANPDIANHPTYAPYVNAFVEKILADPSPLVRQPLLLALELGYLKKVSEPAIHLLEKLAGGNGLWGQEPGIIRGVLPNLNQPDVPLPSTKAHPNLAGGEELLADSTHGAPAAPQPHFGQRLNRVSGADTFGQNSEPGESRPSAGRRLNLMSSG